MPSPAADRVMNVRKDRDVAVRYYFERQNPTHAFIVDQPNEHTAIKRKGFVQASPYYMKLYREWYEMNEAHRTSASGITCLYWSDAQLDRLIHAGVSGYRGGLRQTKTGVETTDERLVKRDGRWEIVKET